MAAIGDAGQPGVMEHHGWAPGDRLEVVRRGDDGIAFLPEDVWAEGFRIEDSGGGGALRPAFDAATGGVLLRELSGYNGQDVVWLEYRGGSVLAVVRDEPPSSVSPDAAELTTEQGLHVSLDPADRELLRDGFARVTPHGLSVALRAARLATHAGFDKLICLPLVRDMELLEHQIRTAKTVLRRFRGRALLCDEVGLGKTIEAGLILSELLMRGLARSVLVLVPPSLIEQWQGELRRKFSVTLTSHDDPAFVEQGGWQACERVIASIHTAKREPHRSAILGRKWDLVIVDEAHHLRNRTTQTWKFASELEKQFILLLTATPVQNNLEELFNLVTLLEPGLLSTSKQFQKRFVDRKDKLAPKNVDELHALLAEVMVRNRRSTVGLQFTRRWAKTESIRFSPGEQRLYDETTALVREHLRGDEPATAETPDGGAAVAETPAAEAAAGEIPAEQEAAAMTSVKKPAGRKAVPKKKALNRMALVALQMALGSSSAAAAGTLRKMSQQPKLEPLLAERLAALAGAAERQSDSSKVERLLTLLDEFPDKMVVFTQFRATQELLADRLRGAGHDVAVFHGGLSRLEKEAAVERFRGPARLLSCTEAGSEGRNLQFAHAICNFDLPWNPMKIEQRIGRLSRIGQTHDVYVFNLVASGTVEAAVLHLLEAKLSMFELVIGEIDMILGNLDEEREFQDVVADVLAESADGGDFSQRMEDLGNRLVAAKEAYLKQRSHDDKLFGNRFAPEG